MRDLDLQSAIMGWLIIIIALLIIPLAIIGLIGIAERVL